MRCRVKQKESSMSLEKHAALKSMCDVSFNVNVQITSNKSFSSAGFSGQNVIRNVTVEQSM